MEEDLTAMPQSPYPSQTTTSWGTPAPAVRIPKLKIRVQVDEITPLSSAPKPVVVEPSPAGTAADSVSRFSTSTGPSHASSASSSGSITPKDVSRELSPSSFGTARTKKSSWAKLFTAKEPSTAAFIEYANQQKKAPKAPRATPSPGFSKQRLPDFVPKVNSKWDGMPNVAHEPDREAEWKKSSDTLRRTQSARTSMSSASRPGTARSGRGHERSNGHLNLLVSDEPLPPLPASIPTTVRSTAQSTAFTSARPSAVPSSRTSTELKRPAKSLLKEGSTTPPVPAARSVQPARLDGHSGDEDVAGAKRPTKPILKVSSSTPLAPAERSMQPSRLIGRLGGSDASSARRPASVGPSRTQAPSAAAPDARQPNPRRAASVTILKPEGDQPQWPLSPVAATPQAKLATADSMPRPVAVKPAAAAPTARVPIPAAAHRDAGGSPSAPKAPRNFARPFVNPSASTAKEATKTPTTRLTAPDPGSVAGPVALRPPALAIGRPITKDSALEPIIEVDGQSIISVPVDSAADDDDRAREELEHDEDDVASAAGSEASAESIISESWHKTPRERLGLGGSIKHDRNSGPLPKEMSEEDIDYVLGLDEETKAALRKRSRGSRGSLSGLFRRSSVIEPDG